MSAPAPAPASTTTSTSLAFRRRTTSGTSATRRSPGAFSLGTPTRMVAEQPIGSRVAAAQEPQRAWDRAARPRPARRAEGLHGGGRVVDRARPAASGEVEAAVAVLAGGDPRRAAPQAAAARRLAGGAQRQDAERRQV